MHRTWLLLLVTVPVWAGTEFSIGPAGGMALPLGGNIRRYQTGFGAGLDVRVTGFQPVVGLGVSGGYVRFAGPYHDSLRKDSSRYNYRYIPVAVYLLTDFSRLFSDAPVRPYLRLGAGPCYWDWRCDSAFFYYTQPDSSRLSSRQWDYDFLLALGAERRLGNLPLSAFIECTGEYITSSHFEKYSVLDKDESYARLALGFRYHLR